jgi:nucleotide-binding universal stress UspA family protein
VTIKHILVPTIGAKSSGTVLGTSLLLARLFNAHAEILFIKQDLLTVLPLAADGITGSFAEEMGAKLRGEQDEEEKVLRQAFDDLLMLHQIDYSEHSISATEASASWTAVAGSARDRIINHGTVCDLLVVGQPTHDVESSSLLEAALFGTGRPVLVSPPEVPETIGENILVGWNRSALSARAVQSAMPFLERARETTIITVTTGAKLGPSPQDLSLQLVRHGIETRVKEIAPDYRSVGESLLAEAEDAGSDLLVIGAYSRGRLRELLMGGVTRHVLANAEVPVLMVH